MDVILLDYFPRELVNIIHGYAAPKVIIVEPTFTEQMSQAMADAMGEIFSGKRSNRKVEPRKDGKE